MTTAIDDDRLNETFAALAKTHGGSRVLAHL